MTIYTTIVCDGTGYQERIYLFQLSIEEGLNAYGWTKIEADDNEHYCQRCIVDMRDETHEKQIIRPE